MTAHGGMVCDEKAARESFIPMWDFGESWEGVCFSSPAWFAEEEKQSKKTGKGDALKSAGALGGYCLCFLNNGF